MQYLHENPGSRNIEDLVESFVSLAKKDIALAKTVIRTHVKYLKNKVEEDKVGVNSVPNKLRPIRALLVSNDINTSWTSIRKMLPRETIDRYWASDEIKVVI